jgi:magnesium transporter
MGEDASSTTPLMLWHNRNRGAALGDTPPPAVRARAAPKPESQCVFIDAAGVATFGALRKQHLVSDLQLRHRDIRALEPGVALPYPAAIFVRRNAVIVNLEGLKLIISRDRTLVISAPPLDDLSVRHKPAPTQPAVARLAAAIAAARLEAPVEVAPAAAAGELPPPAAADVRERPLPYELRALEAALALAVTVLSREVGALEAATHPVLLRIRASVEHADLEAMYDTRNRLDKAHARVSKLKEVLEELLDDEEELSRVALSHSAPDPAGESPRPGGAPPAAPPSRARSSAAAASLDLDGAAGDARAEDMSELQDMVEAFWMQTDSLVSRLRALQERIRNTEHLVNLDLDSKRNSLVALGLVLDIVLVAFEVRCALRGVSLRRTRVARPLRPFRLTQTPLLNSLAGPHDDHGDLRDEPDLGPRALGPLLFVGSRRRRRRRCRAHLGRHAALRAHARAADAAQVPRGRGRCARRGDAGRRRRRRRQRQRRGSGAAAGPIARVSRGQFSRCRQRFFVLPPMTRPARARASFIRLS